MAEVRSRCGGLVGPAIRWRSPALPEIEAVLSRRKPAVSPKDGRRALLLADAAL